MTTRSVTGGTARALAARLGEHGYRVTFPPGRDPAVFKVTGLPGSPDVEVSVEDSGQAACHYVGCSAADVADLIARLPKAGAAESDTLTATWGGIEIEWDYQPRARQPASPDQVAAALLAHLAARIAPGNLLRRIADALAGAGLDVRQPDSREGRLDIAWPGARCTLAVGDCGHVEWEYCPGSPQDGDPGLTADLATALLTGRTGPHPRPRRGHQRENITFRGLVGLELKARGLNVELAVYCDEAVFDVFAEIVATVPGDDVQVRVTDDGGLTWTRDHQAAPAAVADSVAEAVTRAMSCLRPARTGRSSHG